MAKNAAGTTSNGQPVTTANGGQQMYPGGDPNGPPRVQTGTATAPLPPGSPPPQIATPSPGSIAGSAPAPVQAFGPTASVNPTYGAATQINPVQAQQYLQQYLKQLQTSLAPGNKQQMQQLNDSLAARGITNSGAGAQLMTDLQGQQAAAYAAQAQPLISQGFGYAQQDTTGNAAAENTQTLANQGYANAASNTNAAYYNQATNTNAQNYNAYLDQLEQQGYNTYSQDTGAYLNSFAPSPAVEGLYDNGVSGAYGVYGNIYGSALSSQGQAAAGAGEGLGQYEAAAAAAG